MRTYTTSELLNKLDIGQKAEMIAPVPDIIVQRKDSGIIVLQDCISSKHKGQPMPLTPTVLNATWIIHRTPITFEKAIAHIRNGNTVLCEHDGRPPISYDSLDDLIHIAEAVDGVWYLED